MLKRAKKAKFREKLVFSPGTVFLICCAFTFTAWFVAERSSKAENAARFERSAAALLTAFKGRMNIYTNALVYTRNLMDLKPDLSTHEFKAFVSGMNLRSEFPGIQNIGYARRMTPAMLRKALPQLPERSKKLLDTPKDHYDVAVVVESIFNSGTTALGLDLSVTPERVNAMSTAAALGRPVATSRVKPLSAPVPKPGEFFFIVFVPHYEPGAPIATPEERLAAIRGFVWGSFRVPYLFGNIAGDAKMPINKLILRVFDGPTTDPANLIYAKGDLDAADSEFYRVIDLIASERQWRIEMRATPDFASSYSRWLPVMVLLLGSIWTVAVTLSAIRSRNISVALSTSRKAADSANHAKTLFLANVSHEIRTPLGIILGFAELTAENSHDPKMVESNMAKLLRNGRELTRIIGEVLDLSKIEANSLLIEKTRFPLHPFFTELENEWRPIAQAKKIDLQVHLGRGLPRELSTDSTRLLQILTNLLSNAMKFTDRGFIRVGVTCEENLEGEGARLLVSVEDSGMGIAEDHKSRLFTSFSQGDSSITRKFGGSGLGLALSKQLAQALGGSLTLVRSQVSRGSLFLLSLPTHLEKAGESPHPPAVFDQPAETLDRVRVLLVEDSEDNQALISTFLGKAGAHVEFADNGEAGVAKALSREYDVILMDIQMPVLDGYGAFERLREAGYTRPVIALTAHAMIEEKERAFRLGFHSYLTKPVNRKQLILSVHRAARTGADKAPVTTA